MSPSEHVRLHRRAAVVVALWMVVLGTVPCSYGQSATTLTLNDILTFERPTGLQISPDGKFVAYVLVKPGEHNVYDGDSSTVWLLDLAARKTRRLFTMPGDLGSQRAWENPSLQWFPDSRELAYLADDTGQPQIWAFRIGSGRRRQLTTNPSHRDSAAGEISEFAISPSGDRIAYVRTDTREVEQRQLERQKIVAISEHPHFLSRIGTDGSFDEQAEIDVLTVATGFTHRVTSGVMGASALHWSPDETTLVFLPSDHDRGGRWVAPTDPTLVTLATRSLRRLVTTRSVDYSPTWSPDGSEICYLSAVRGPFAGSRSLYRVSPKGEATELVSGDDVALTPRLPIQWTPANMIYVGSDSEATTRVYALPAAGGARTQVTPSQFHVRSYSVSADGRRMAAIFENANTPPEVYVGDPATQQFERVTDLGKDLRRILLGQVDTVRWRSADGRFNVEGFLVKPPDFVPGKRYPLLVMLHGGPAAAYENSFWDVNIASGYHSPAQLYAARGYLVLLPNDRGDPSYGPEFRAALVKHLGDDVLLDMLAGVDALVARGLADSSRLGIMGNSYGAYAAAWAISHTPRFKAASLNDGLYDLLSDYGQAYLRNSSWVEYYLSGSPSEVIDEYLERSPILHAARIQTPTLIRIGQDRFPRPIAMPLQGMELFRALHERGIPVELLYHPTQGHVILDREVYRDWVQRNLRWFDYWLLGKGTNPLGEKSVSAQLE